MSCPITALTRSVIESITTKNNKQQNEQIQKLHGRNPISILKAPSNNVKMKSDKTLTTQI